MMMNRVAALGFALLLIAGSAMAMEAQPEYKLHDTANFFSSVYIQPNGDLIVEGTAIRTGDENSWYDVARISPDGKIVWGKEFDYVGEEGIGGLEQMADGTFVLIRYAATEDRRKILHFFDTDGYIGHTEPLEGWFYPASDFMISKREIGNDTYRIGWVDMDGNEFAHYDHASKEEPANLYVIEGKDCIFIEETPDGVYGVLSLTKVGSDQQMAWHNEYDLLGYQYIFSDGEGGVYAIGVFGEGSNAFQILHIDSDGELVLTDILELRDTYTVMNFDERDDVQLVLCSDTELTLIRYDSDGNRVTEVRALPASEHEDAVYHVSGLTTAPDGRLYIFGREVAVTSSDFYGPFLISVDSLSLVGN